MKKRGEETRSQLLDAAVELFGRYGFEGTSVRMLAAQANCNLAAIPYHFGSKDGLYLAVATHLAQSMRERLGGEIQKISQHLQRTDATRESVFAGMIELLLKFGESILDKSPSVARYVMREQLEPTQAFDELYNTLARELHETLSLCVSRLEGLAAESPACIIRTHMIMGSFIGFISGRSVFLRRMGWQSIDEEKRQILRREIRTFLAQLFHLPQENENGPTD